MEADRSHHQVMDSSHHKDVHSGPHWKGDGSSIVSTSCQRVYMLQAKALHIIWGNDLRYWRWIEFSEEDSRLTGSTEGALLVQVNWIDVAGKLATSAFHSAPGTTFEIHYVVKFQCDAFGWHSAPVKFKVRLNGEEVMVTSVLLEQLRNKHDAWHEIYGGEFTIPDHQDGKAAGGVVEFGMFEVETDWWKGGMVLAGIKFKPKEKL